MIGSSEVEQLGFGPSEVEGSNPSRSLPRCSSDIRRSTGAANRSEATQSIFDFPGPGGMLPVVGI